LICHGCDPYDEQPTVNADVVPMLRDPAEA
jgi:hypothetical protein